MGRGAPVALGWAVGVVRAIRMRVAAELEAKRARGRPGALTEAQRRMAVLALAGMIVLAGGAQADRPLAPLDVSSPAATLQSFLSEARAIEAAIVAYRAAPDHARARAFEELVQRTGRLFDTGHLPPAIRTEVAGAAFGFLYDILLRLPPEDIAAAFAAMTDSNPQSPWMLPNTEITILRIEEGENAGSWLFSPRTLARLPEFHRAIIAFPLQQPSAVENWHLAQSNLSGPFFADVPVDRLPDWLTHARVLDTPVWKLVLTLAIWLGVALIVLVWMQALGRLTARAGMPVRSLARLSAPALLAGLVIWARGFAELEISLSGGAFAQTERTVTLLVLYLAAAWAAWLTILALVETVLAAPFSRDNPYHANLLRLVGKVLALTSAGLVAILGLNEVGVPALGVVAGFGVGGFAVALAAKSTVENLFGGLTLFADKPFRVGDFVSYQEGTGVVESIGPRSSRLRGLDGTLTTIPNTELVSVRITNYTDRDKCLFTHRLAIRYETTPDQLEALLQDIQRALVAHPLVEQTPGMPWVYLIGLGDMAITLELRAQVRTTQYTTFLAVQQELLLEVMRLVERCGSRLATRTQTVFIGRDSGLGAAGPARGAREGAEVMSDGDARPSPRGAGT